MIKRTAYLKLLINSTSHSRPLYLLLMFLPGLVVEPLSTLFTDCMQTKASLMLFVNKRGEGKGCKSTRIEGGKHRIWIIYGDQKVFFSFLNEENSLAGEFSKVRNNILFLQHIGLKEISEWINMNSAWENSARKRGKILMLLAKFDILQCVHRWSKHRTCRTGLQ